MSEPFDFMPDDWSQFEKEQYHNTFGDTFYSDWQVETMYHHAFFDFDMSEGRVSDIRDSLRGYLMDEYGIAFDEHFDWEAWRDAYESA